MSLREKAGTKRESLVAGKQLGDLAFSEVESGHAKFAATLEVTVLKVPGIGLATDR